MAAGEAGESRLFGGKLVAQALGAAALTISSGRRVHSQHGSFLLAGDGREPITYEVEPTRDGASFSLRRTTARQGERLLFVATTSFHAPEHGLSYELPGPANVPSPDGLPSGRYDSRYFESRDVPEEWPYETASPDSASAPGWARRPDSAGSSAMSADSAGSSAMSADHGFVAPHARLAWFRSRLPIPENELLHAQAIAYLSDYGATRGIRQPHAAHPRMEDRMSVSLSHSLWIAAAARVDGWVLSEFHPVATGAGRGLTMGTIRTHDGRIVASMAQEALLRLPDS